MIVGMIQARMASTRLPGKVLKEVQGKPIIHYVHHRLAATPSIDKTMLLTTTKPEDDALELWAESNGVTCYRGSEHDVLDRYFQAAKTADAKTIVRITGDCPFLDPTLVSRAISALLDGEDYVNSGASFPEGMDCEALSFEALSRAHKSARRKYQREHVTRYMHDNKHLFRMKTLELDADYGKFRVTVDESDDFEVICKLMELLGERGESAEHEEIITLLRQHPEICRINGNIIRNEGLLRSMSDGNNTKSHKKTRPL